MIDGGRRLGALLAAVEAAPPSMAVAVLGRELAEWIAARDVSMLITDFGGRAVVRLTGRSPEGNSVAPEPIPLGGTVYDRVIRSQRLQVEPLGSPESVGPGAVRVIAPVADRGDAIGLLEITVASAPDPSTLRLVEEAAHALAYVVIANRRFTDVYEWGRRTTRMSLAAEIQHRLLPDSFTCDAGRFIVAGALEPAADIGGDTFDYSVDRESLHLSLTDAMGHDVQAALLATVVVGALRNARRAGGHLLDQAREAHAAVVRYSDPAQHLVGEETGQVRDALAPFGRQVMVTGQLLRISMGTGEAEFVNAGHVWPLRLRDGRVEVVPPLIDLPFGITPNPGYRVQRLDLRPGDRLVLLTDGMLEPLGDDDAVRRLLLDTGEWHPRDAMRALTEAVLDRTGHDPRDDATALCLDWSLAGRSYAEQDPMR